MKNQREIKKKDPEFYRKLLALLIPMVVQNLMNALVSASDALMAVSYTHLDVYKRQKQRSMMSFRLWWMPEAVS